MLVNLAAIVILVAVPMASAPATSQIATAYYPVVGHVSVMATGYNKDDGNEWCFTNKAGARECGTHVFGGGPPWVGTVAVSRSLRARLPMYSRVRIRGWDYMVRDLMGPSVTAEQIDIYFPTVAAAREWGFKRVDLHVLGPRTTVAPWALYRTGGHW